MQYLFEGYVLDTDRRELRRGAALVSIEPKVFADGIMEDITTELSRFSELLVIA